MIGRNISHYKILEKLGEGGMGVVYKAEDTKLRRTVALKFLRSGVLASAEHKERFQREAQAAAALDHPNICTVYEIDEGEGQTFLAMAFVEGQSVKAKIAERPLKLEEALDIAIQTAQGLQAAHERGIVHRDIKPANLLINSQGQVKILDFGLAQLGDRSRLTQTSTLLGTPGYMSPEQADRASADRRTDIWSLGTVLYEMVTGRAPFDGEREAAVLHAIVHEEHEPVTALRVRLPTELDRILAKALAKKTAERYQHADDMLVDLRALRAIVDSGARRGTPAPAKPTPRRRMWGVAAAAVAVIAVVVLTRPGKQEAPPVAMRSVPLTSYPGDERNPSFSPDGSQVVFSWNGPARDNYDIYALPLGSTDPLRLTENPATDVKPVWSPDGRQIAFVRALRDRQVVYIIPPMGGAERKLAEFTDLDPSSLSWAPDGKSLVYAEFTSTESPESIGQLFWETGERRVLTTPPQDLFGDKYPAISPDGRTLAFVRAGAGAWEIRLQPIGGGPARALTSHGGLSHGLTWTPDGSEIVYWWTASYMYPISMWRVSVRAGERSEVTSSGQGAVGHHTDKAEVFHAPAISQQGGRLVYERVSADVNIWRYSLSGETGDAAAPRRLVASTQVDAESRISPDGTRIVFDSTRTGSTEIWVADADGSNQRPLTAFGDEGASGSPRWSPDGRSVAFDARKRRSNSWDIFVADLDGGPPRPVASHEAQDTRPSWSRDGRWIYFGSNRSGVSQIWKVSVDGGEPVQISEAGGLHPFESDDGRFVYFQRPGASGSVSKIPVDGGEEVVVLPTLQGGVLSRWDVAAEGIYFIEYREELGDQWFLRLLRFGETEAEDVMVLPTPAGGSPLDIAPDGQSFLYVQVDSFNSDLVLVENFR